MLKVEDLDIRQVIFTKAVDIYLEKISYHLSDLEEIYFIRVFINLIPFEIRYLFYENLSNILTKEKKVDIIELLKTKIKKMEGSK